jgi:CPA1 family monovalent cation:H+ antiporter
MTPTTRIVVFNFWQFAAFLANSFVFLLIGLEVEIPLLIEYWAAILVAIGAVLLARAAVVYGTTALNRGLPFRWQHIIFWGGLRGAISLALALSIPLTLGEGRSELQAMAFGVVLFTLVVQGLSMQPLVRRLGISPRHEKREEFQMHQARVASIQSAYEHLKNLHDRGLISNKAWRSTSKVLDDYLERLSAHVQELLENEPSLAKEEIDLAWREVLRAKRSALASLHTDGMIGEDAFSELVGRVDAALDEEDLNWEQIEGMDAF